MPRIITGSAKNLHLDAISGTTRPLTDRIKTSIFDTISEFVAEARVLDLFAGSGSFGIEALSRGAAWATFVEADYKAMQILQKNIYRSRLDSKAETFTKPAIKFLHSYQEQFDLIFLDPPFSLKPEIKQQTLEKAFERLLESGLLIFRFPQKEKYSDEFQIKTDLYRMVYKKKYGQSLVTYYRNDKVIG